MASVDVHRIFDRMRRLAVGAGFEVIAQRDVRWRFQRIAPLILTVGQAPTRLRGSSREGLMPISSGR